jgi:hypothetical protein
MNTSIRAAMVAAAALGAIALPAAAMASISPSTTYHAGSCRASGGFATCVEGGTATRPYTIYAHVAASPNQSVHVAWNMVCAKGSGAGSRSGSFTATTPVTKKLSHPYRYPDNCTISVDAQLSHGGSLHVWTTYHRW